jgi:hypothetical protein
MGQPEPVRVLEQEPVLARVPLQRDPPEQEPARVPEPELRRTDRREQELAELVEEQGQEPALDPHQTDRPEPGQV